MRGRDGGQVRRQKSITALKALLFGLKSFAALAVNSTSDWRDLRGVFAGTHNAQLHLLAADAVTLLQWDPWSMHHCMAPKGGQGGQIVFTVPLGALFSAIF